MLSNRTGQWTVGAALLCVAVLVASWLLLISPRRSDAADLRGQAATANSQAQQAQLKTAQLRSEFADLPKQKAALAAIRAQLPPKADVPALVSDLQVQATAAGVSLNSIVPGTPTVVGSSASGATTANTLATAGSVVAIPVTLAATGDYFEDALFVKYLQTKLTRSILVTTVTTATAGDTTTATTSTPASTGTATPTATPTPAATTGTTSSSDSVQLTLSGSVFVLLDSSSTLGQVAKDAQKATSGSSS